MNEKKLQHQFLRGLPCTGKSTLANSLIAEHPNQYVRINREELESVLLKSTDDVNKSLLYAIEESLIAEAIRHGKYIIWDNMHLSEEDDSRRKLIESKYGISFEVRTLLVDLQEAIMRDSLRANHIGAEKIKYLFDTYLRTSSNLPQYPVFDERKMDAWILDLDGTLAFNGSGRGWYEYDRVGEDVPNSPLVKLIHRIQVGKAFSERFLIVTGREDGYVARKETFKWITDNGIPCDYLYMRKAKDQRADDIVKEEIYREHIEGHYNVLGIFDDRLSVCKMWYRLNLPIYRVGDPEAKF
jgi:predicted kinase